MVISRFLYFSTCLSNFLYTDSEIIFKSLILETKTCMPKSKIVQVCCWLQPSHSLEVLVNERLFGLCFPSGEFHLCVRKQTTRVLGSHMTLAPFQFTERTDSLSPPSPRNSVNQKTLSLDAKSFSNKLQNFVRINIFAFKQRIHFVMATREKSLFKNSQTRNENKFYRKS